MKDIYLLLTKSDTFVSKAIYLMTQDSYTHISISFEENLQPMYSCARKYTYSPIPAGISHLKRDSIIKINIFLVHYINLLLRKRYIIRQNLF